MSTNSHFYCCYFFILQVFWQRISHNLPNREKTRINNVSSQPVPSISELRTLIMRLSGIAKCVTIASFHILTHLTWKFLQGHSVPQISCPRKIFLVFTGIKLACAWIFKATWAPLPLEFFQDFSALFSGHNGSPWFLQFNRIFPCCDLPHRRSAWRPGVASGRNVQESSES